MPSMPLRVRDVTTGISHEVERSWFDDRGRHFSCVTKCGLSLWGPLDGQFAQSVSLGGSWEPLDEPPRAECVDERCPRYAP